MAGFEHPRVAVAALNPHGGEGGTCGREEIDIIAPAISEANADGYAIAGPFPADTIFLKARDGQYDGIVTMYHDQGQIALRLLGFERGVDDPRRIADPDHHARAWLGIRHCGPEQGQCRGGRSGVPDRLPHGRVPSHDEIDTLTEYPEHLRDISSGILGGPAVLRAE